MTPPRLSVQIDFARRVATLDLQRAFRCRASEADLLRERAVAVVASLELLDRHWDAFLAFVGERGGEGVGELVHYRPTREVGGSR